MSMSPNRMVAVATPLVFAPLAGAITALAAQYAPGLDIDSGQLEAIFIAGATIAFAKAGLWMKGWQDYEKRQEATHVVASDAAEDPYGDDDEIVDEVVVEEIVDEVVDEPGDDIGDDIEDWDTALDDEIADEPIEDADRDDVLVAGAS